MQIFFEQSGGFAGIGSTASVDTEALSEEEAQQVARLVEEADFFNLPERIVPQRPQPDRYQYLVKIEEGSRRHSVTVSEEAVPPALSPLIRWLQDVVRKNRESLLRK